MKGALARFYRFLHLGRGTLTNGLGALPDQTPPAPQPSGPGVVVPVELLAPTVLELTLLPPVTLEAELLAPSVLELTLLGGLPLPPSCSSPCCPPARKGSP